MFAAPRPNRHAGGYHALTSMYRQVGAESAVGGGASPHRMVTMLFDGAIEAIVQARGALRNREIEAKGRAIGRAARIIEEGLKAGLNRQAGGELAQHLHDLYVYLGVRLTLANLRNDAAMLEECQRLLEPVRDAWVEIGARVPA